MFLFCWKWLCNNIEEWLAHFNYCTRQLVEFQYWDKVFHVVKWWLRKKGKNVSISDAKLGNVYIAFPPMSFNSVVLFKNLIDTINMFIVLSCKPWALNGLSFTSVLLPLYLTYCICLSLCAIAIKGYVSSHSAITKFPLCSSFYSPLCLNYPGKIPVMAYCSTDIYFVI